MELRSMVIESLVELGKYLGRANPEIEQIANYLYSGVEEKALEKVPLLIEGLSWVVEVLNHATPFYSDIIPTKIYLFSLNGYLIEIEEAMKEKDWILFADLLQYQLIPLLEQISEKIKEIGFPN